MGGACSRRSVQAAPKVERTSSREEEAHRRRSVQDHPATELRDYGPISLGITSWRTEETHRRRSAQDYPGNTRHHDGQQQQQIHNDDINKGKRVTPPPSHGGGGNKGGPGEQRPSPAVPTASTSGISVTTTTSG